jgi:cystathionine gamma-lyase
MAVRLERQEATARALVELLQAHPAVTDVRWPGIGAVLVFTLADADAAERLLGSLKLVADATSFGGVHSTAERRARWGTDDLADGFIRFSAGIEDTADLVADLRDALDAVDIAR